MLIQRKCPSCIDHIVCIQGIQNMIRLLFVPSEQLLVFEDVDILHGKPLRCMLPEIGT